MRDSQNVRYLAAHETMIARSVYIDTIPYGLVFISDGLGGGDRPFTVPTILPIHIPFYNFNVKGDGKYVIHAGDGYYGMSTLFKDKKTLIHDLAHVWQGEHYKSWSWTYAVFSLKDQALSGDAAYAYDKTYLRPWDDYGPEQQAQIVEDGFADGMKTYDPTTGYGRSPVLLHQETYSGRARRWRLAHASHQTASGGKTGGQGVPVLALGRSTPSYPREAPSSRRSSRDRSAPEGHRGRLSAHLTRFCAGFNLPPRVSTSQRQAGAVVSLPPVNARAAETAPHPQDQIDAALIGGGSTSAHLADLPVQRPGALSRARDGALQNRRVAALSGGAVELVRSKRVAIVLRERIIAPRPAKPVSNSGPERRVRGPGRRCRG